MKNSTKKFSLITVLAAIFAAFAIFATLSAVESSGANVAFADEEASLLETKAKVSLDNKYLLLITGFDPALIDPNGYYYMGYKYTVGETAVDTGRRVSQAYYYASVTLRTDLEDATKTQEVTPQMIYGEDYADYKLLVYEIKFEHSFSEDIAEYSNIRAYIDHVDELGTSIIESFNGNTYYNKEELPYRLLNGGFETGDLTGWTIEMTDGNKIGDVVEQGYYWNEKVSFNKNGNYLFSAYTDVSGSDADIVISGEETAKGTLTSSEFTIGGSGWITFRFGGGRNYEEVYFDVLESETNELLARYYNSSFTEDELRGCQLNQYRADLSAFLGKKAYIRITDNASAGYGLFFVDDIVTYYRNVPTIGVEAENIAESGSFGKGLDGWTMDGNIGGISQETTFWGNVPFNNTGKFFRGDLDGREIETGTLTSSDFVVRGSGWITFKLGAAKNGNCYIELQKKNGDVYEQNVAIWHNNLFVDEGENSDAIGNGLRMVDYKVDLREYLNETMRIVLHDNATGDFGFFTFDELKTYYTVEPDGQLMANQLTARAELLAALDSAINEQGDYTSESYAAYEAKRNAVSNLDEHAKIATIDAALEELAAAESALALREPEAVADSVKELSIYAEGTLNVTLSDYVDVKSLSKISYEVTSSASSIVRVGEVENGVVTLTAADVSDETATVTIVVKYDNVEKVSVALTVTVTKDVVPELKSAAVERSIDIYTVQNKTDLTIDFADNVNNLGGLELTYSVKQQDDDTPIDLNGSAYTFTYGSYTYEYTDVVFAVTVSFEVNGERDSINYNYTLHVKNTTAYRIVNGGFETGDLTGWTISDSENPFGEVRNFDNWFDNISYNKDGVWLFTGVEDYANGAKQGNGLEGNTGTLTSDPFTVGGIGYLTFKLGGGGNKECYIEIIDENDVVLAKYHTQKLDAAVMYVYRANLSDHIGETVRVRVVDNAHDNWGCLAVDSFVSYYESLEDLPDGFDAINYKYQVLNGGFERGDLTGWTVEMTAGDKLGEVVSEDHYIWWYPETNESTKEGTYLFTFHPGDGEANYEGGKGTLTSSEFVLKKDSVISFCFGAAWNPEVRIEVWEVGGANPIATFRNNAYTSSSKMVKYCYQFNNSSEMTCYFKIVDNADSNYGCFIVDGFNVNRVETIETLKSNGYVIASSQTKEERLSQ